jgi:hypothetical protein
MMTIGTQVPARWQTNQLPRREQSADSSETPIDQTGEDAEEASGRAALTQNGNCD